MNILLDEKYRGAATSRLHGHNVRYFPGSFSDKKKFAEMLQDVTIAGFSRMLSFPLDESVLENAKKLEFIHKSGSGADWFDLDLLDRKGILLGLNTGFNAVTVAEHALALMLMCLRRMPEFVDIIRDGKWQLVLPGNPLMSMQGKRVGIVGIGRTGNFLAKAVMAMEASVVCYHPDPNKPLPSGATRVGLDELFATSDIVTLHVPLNEGTTKFISAHHIGLMKPTSIFINTARGGVVDESALVAALMEKRIRAAGLDVFETEPLPADHPLRTLPNVVATPHVGGGSIEIDERQNQGTIENIELFLAGKRPERLVNPHILENGSARAAHIAKATA